MIRNATIEDALRIAEIQVSSWRAAYRGMIPDSYLQELRVDERERTWKWFAKDSGSRLLVVTELDGVVGFCHISPSRDNDSPDAAEIIAIYVDPLHWRKGLGQLLCKSALSFAREQGFTAVTLWTLSENQSARRFYEALGFAPDGTTKIESMNGFELHEVRYIIHLEQGEAAQDLEK